MSLFTEIYQDVEPIALIGAGCRFMNATDPFTFWRRLADGEELSRRVAAEDLRAAGLDPALLERDDFVAVASVVDEAECFDAAGFGYSPAEAATIDPQQRLFLSCAWEALEMADLAASAAGQRIGVFGAARMSTHVFASPDDVLGAGMSRTFQRLIGNDKDYLATRVAYKLGLTGPAMTVQTACSSSLVAVHMACEQLRSGECDLALAGGAALTFPMAAGYFHQPGMIFSPDGACRPFDASASGTFIGNGVGVVLLKPLRRALEDGDGILAVIRGSAVNNDGTDKAGFTAPSLAGQRAVIEEALALAGVTSDQVGMVETHGTGTPLGDPIELNALAEAFGRDTPRSNPCALGALKANTGHLDTAAGVAALLKAAFSVKTGLIAPCLHFRAPNPALEIEATPFVVPQALEAWPDGPRIAGVSSFGIGGTNCHLVIEDLPEPLKPPALETDGQLRLALSGPDLPALRQLADIHAGLLLDGSYDGDLGRYCQTMERHREASGHTLQVGGRDGLELARKLALFAETGGEDVAVSHAGTASGASWASERREAERAASVSAPVLRVIAPVAPRIGQRISRVTTAAGDEDGWDELVAGLVEASRLRAASHDWSSLGEEAEAVAHLHAVHVAHAFDRLGVFENGAWRALGDVMEAGRILPQFAQLTARLLRDLVQEGVLDRNGDAYGDLRAVPLGAARPVLEDMAGRGYRRLTGMVARVGPHLADMLTGAVDPVSLVFPSAAMDDVEDMYERQRDSVFLNDLAADAVSAVVGALPVEAPVRVLEIGAGTGGTTSALLSLLPADRSRYTFTDIGPLFLRKAREKFAAFPFLDFAVLDIEQDLVGQGFDEGGYDLVVAANVLHNGSDLTRVLGSVRRLLAPGGVLLMREISEPKPLFDFIFGPLVPVLDDIGARAGELFPSLPRWGGFLMSAGYSDWSSFPPKGQQAGAIGETIILARNPGRVDRGILRGAAGESLVRRTAPPVTMDAAGLVCALAARSGDGFWSYEALALAPKPAERGVTWRVSAHELALTGEEATGGALLSARPGRQVGRESPPLPSEGATRFSGGLEQALRQTLSHVGPETELVADAVSGTVGQLADGRICVSSRDAGGLDISVFDQSDWPALWIDNLRSAVPVSVATRPRLCRWRWEAANSSVSCGRVAAVIVPAGGSELAESLGLAATSGWSLPKGLGAGDTCLVDLAIVDGAGEVPDLYAGLAAVTREAAELGCGLVLRTCGALSAVPWDRPSMPLLAGLVGLVRVAVQEYPGLSLRLVDDDGSHAPDVVLRACLAGEGEDVTALRRGRRFVPRLVAEDAGGFSAALLEEGAHLLLGGLSPMGLATAEWLADRGAREIWIAARRVPGAEEAARLAALSETGVELVTLTDIDLADDDDLERLFCKVEGRRLASVFHFAGHLEDVPLAMLDREALERVLSPKLRPAKALLDRLPRIKPGRVVFASSAATVFGPPGQAAHAIANAALEGLAEVARAEGVAATALAWGYWEDRRAERVQLARRLAERGMLSLARDEALSLLERALSLDLAVVCPVHADWQRLSDVAGGRLPPALAGGGLVPGTPETGRKTSQAEVPTVETWLVRRLSGLLGLSEDRIDTDAKLLSLGIDSLMMLELSQSVKTELGIELSAGFVLQDQTPASLARHLREAGARAWLADGGGDDLETRICALIAGLLSLRPGEVRLESRLIDLGLDSLLFLDLGERLATEVGIRLSAETAMRFDTVGALVAGIRAQSADREAPGEGSLRSALEELATTRPGMLLANGDLAPLPARPGMSWPLSPLQRAWWAGRRDAAPLGGTARHMYVEYDKHAGDFDLDAFEQAWQSFVRRHAALRMSIDAGGRAVVAEVDDIPPIARDDLRKLDPKAAEARLSETRARMSDQAFDLASWPFFEWRASLLPDGHIRLHFDIDTTFVDIESFQVMLRELGRRVAEPDRDLPPLTFSGTDYMRGAALVRETEVALHVAVVARGRLADLPATPDLPLLGPPDPAAPTRFVIERRALDRVGWLEARDAAGERGISGTALVLSAFATALRGWSADMDGFSLQLAYSDRMPLHAEAMNIVCEASAAMAVPFDFAGDPPFMEVMRRTEANIREGLSPVLAGGLDEGWAGDSLPTLTLPVVMTSLLGVRQAYALPEAADPLLGMPAYEYAAQPQVALHFQVLEEERELLCNLDEVAGLFPEGLASSVFNGVMRILAGGEACWEQPVSCLAGDTTSADGMLSLRSWIAGVHRGG